MSTETNIAAAVVNRAGAVNYASSIEEMFEVALRHGEELTVFRMQVNGWPFRAHLVRNAAGIYGQVHRDPLTAKHHQRKWETDKEWIPSMSEEQMEALKSRLAATK